MPSSISHKLLTQLTKEWSQGKGPRNSYPCKPGSGDYGGIISIPIAAATKLSISKVVYEVKQPGYPSRYYHPTFVPIKSGFQSLAVEVLYTLTHTHTHTHTHTQSYQFFTVLSRLEEGVCNNTRDTCRKMSVWVKLQ